MVSVWFTVQSVYWIGRLRHTSTGERARARMETSRCIYNIMRPIVIAIITVKVIGCCCSVGHRLGGWRTRVRVCAYCNGLCPNYLCMPITLDRLLDYTYVCTPTLQQQWGYVPTQRSCVCVCLVWAESVNPSAVAQPVNCSVCMYVCMYLCLLSYFGFVVVVVGIL